MSERIRVVQWATGNIGLRALREVIRHPGLELVGVLVYDPAKNCVDAGVLCGEESVGVAATNEPALIHALGADCALYMARALDVDDVVTLLAAGTYEFQFHAHPQTSNGFAEVTLQGSVQGQVMFWANEFENEELAGSVLMSVFNPETFSLMMTQGTGVMSFTLIVKQIL